MQFSGISIDEEGSIIYDGEKFIVRNPRKIPANFNPGRIPVIGLPPNHPSRRAPLPPAPQPFSHAPPPPPPKTAPKNQTQAEPQQPAAPQPSPPDFETIEQDPADIQTEPPLEPLDCNRLLAYADPEFRQLMHDIDLRPQTFKICLELEESIQRVLDFIYASQPDLEARALEYLKEYICQVSDADAARWENATGPDSEARATADLLDLTDWRQLQEKLETEAGYEIIWDEGFDDAKKLETLEAFAQASEHIVDYLDLVFEDDPNMTGRQAFLQRFSHSEHGRLQVFLGAEAVLAKSFGITEHVASYYGFVPLGLEKDDERMRRMYLGSAVDIATIVHEFGHVIDRSTSIVSAYNRTGINHSAHWRDWHRETGLALNRSILDLAIEGFAGKQLLNEEIWADLFMTAVLDPAVSGKTYQVYSTTYELLAALVEQEKAKFMKQGHSEAAAAANAARAFYNCGKLGGCARRPVRWVAKEEYKIADKAPPKYHFLDLLRPILNG